MKPTCFSETASRICHRSRCLALLLYCLAVAMHAQIATYTMTRTSTPPVIDGRLDDSAWKNAVTLDAFRLLGAPEGRETPPLPSTRAMLTYDADALFIAFDCEEPLADSLVANAQEHDGKTWGDDGVEIFLNPSGDRLRYVQLAVNTAGVIMDGYIAAPGTPLDLSYETGATCEANVTADRWTLEIRIPFQGLPLEDPTARWTFHLARNRRAAGQHLTSLRSATTGFHEIAKFDLLAGIDLPERSVAVVRVDPGDCFAGTNTAWVALRNWSAEPREATVNARLHVQGRPDSNDMRDIVIPAREMASVELPWAWDADAPESSLTIEARAQDRIIHTRTYELGPPPPIFGTPERTVFYLYRHAPVVVAIPVQLAAASRDGLHLTWKADDREGTSLGNGMTTVRTDTALIRLFWRQWTDNTVTLKLKLLDDKAVVAADQFTIRLVENPWSD